MCFSKAAPSGASDSKAWRFTWKHRHAWHLRQAQVGWEQTILIHWLKGHERPKGQPSFSRNRLPQTSINFISKMSAIEWNWMELRSVLRDKSLKGSQLLKRRTSAAVADIAADQVGRHLATPGSCCRGLCLRSQTERMKNDENLKCRPTESLFPTVLPLS